MKELVYNTFFPQACRRSLKSPQSLKDDCNACLDMELQKQLQIELSGLMRYAAQYTHMPHLSEFLRLKLGPAPLKLVPP